MGKSSYDIRCLRSPRAGEHSSRVSQMEINPSCHRVCATEHAPCGPFRLLQRRHGLAEIVERGSVVLDWSASSGTCICLI